MIQTIHLSRTDLIRWSTSFRSPLSEAEIVSASQILRQYIAEKTDVKAFKVRFKGTSRIYIILPLAYDRISSSYTSPWPSLLKPTCSSS